MKEEDNSIAYDKDYQNLQFNKDWRQYDWSVIYIEALQFLKPDDRIFEIGCGCGQFAQMISEYGFKNYTGFDFSDVAIVKFKYLNRFNNKLWVFKANVYDIINNLELFDFDTIIAFEVFEHIQDLKVLKGFSDYKKGLKIVFSVPMRDSRGHLRIFTNQQSVIDYYDQYIKIDKIITIDQWFLAFGYIL